MSDNSMSPSKCHSNASPACQSCHHDAGRVISKEDVEFVDSTYRLSAYYACFPHHWTQRARMGACKLLPLVLDFSNSEDATRATCMPSKEDDLSTKGLMEDAFNHIPTCNSCKLPASSSTDGSKALKDIETIRFTKPKP